MHPYHTSWNTQNISKGRHEATSPLAIPAYCKSNAHPARADDHTQHMDNPSCCASPQTIWCRPPPAQKAEDRQAVSAYFELPMAGNTLKANKMIGLSWQNSLSHRYFFYHFGVSSFFSLLKLNDSLTACPKLSSTYTSIVWRSVECEM